MNESNKATLSEFTASEKEKYLEEIRQRLADIVNPYFPYRNKIITDSSIGRFKQ